MTRTVLIATDDQLTELYRAAAGAQHAIDIIRSSWSSADTASAREQLLAELTTAGERLAAAIELERARPTPRRPTSTRRRAPEPVTDEQAEQHAAELVDALPPRPNAGRRPPQFVNRQAPPYVAPVPIPTEAEWTAPTCGTCGARVDPVMGRTCGCS